MRSETGCIQCDSAEVLQPWISADGQTRQDTSPAGMMVQEEAAFLYMHLKLHVLLTMLACSVCTWKELLVVVAVPPSKPH